MSSPPPPNRRLGVIAAVTTASCWAFLALLLKFALLKVDPVTVVWYRMFVAFLCLGVWMSFFQTPKDLKILGSRPGALLIAALGLAWNYLGFMNGIHYTTPANAQIFIQTGPLLLALSGIFFFKESLSVKQMVGFLLCLAGFGTFFSDRMQAFESDPKTLYLGLFWIFSAAGTWAVFASLQKKLLLVWKSSQINLYTYLVSAILFVPWVDWTTLSELSLSFHLYLGFLGLNTLLAYGSLSVALKNLPATQVSPIITLNPLFTLAIIAIMEAVGMDLIPPDPVNLTGYLGALMAVTGIIVVLTGKASTKVQ